MFVWGLHKVLGEDSHCNLPSLYPSTSASALQPSSCLVHALDDHLRDLPYPALPHFARPLILAGIVLSGVRALERHLCNFPCPPPMPFAGSLPPQASCYQT